MSDTVSLELVRREAQGLRGRKGSDIWQRWVDATLVRQEDYLLSLGVPDSRVLSVRVVLTAILHDEGIRRQ